MFIPKTQKIQKLAVIYPDRIKELEQVFDKKTIVYIDYANVIHWATKLKWKIDLKRMKQLFDSFSNIEKVKIYNGTLTGNTASEDFIKEAKKLAYEVYTKPVKIMRLSCDVSGIPKNSPAILQNFIKKPLLDLLTLKTIEYLNTELQSINQKGTTTIEHKKCNFDVEIGRNMLADYDKNKVENFVLFSGDSDFADPVAQLMHDGKKVVLFATARRISVELAQTKAQVFEINKIRNFLCWSRDIQPDIQSRL